MPLKLMRIPLFILVLAAPGHLFASAELDSRYGFRSVGVAVVGTEANPIFASQVRKAIEAEVALLPRFELKPDLSPALEKATEGIPELGGFATVTWAPALEVLSQDSAQGGVFAAITKGGEKGQGTLQLALVANDGTPIYRSESPVEDAKSVPSYVGTARRMVREMSTSLPFDATVMSRDGYRLVLDHGSPDLYAGMKLAAYTIEMQNGRLNLTETGRLEIVRAESRIAFAQVLMEKKPRQIASLNKVRFEPVRETDTFLPLLPTPGRNVASIGGAGGMPDGDEGFSTSVASFSRNTHGRYGSVDVDLITSFVTWNRTGATNAEVGSDTAFYPGVGIQGELWMTRNWLIDAGFQLALSGLPAPSGSGAKTLNSQISQLFLMAGYRFRLVNNDLTPVLTVKGGLKETSYKVDSPASFLAPATGKYSGLGLEADLGIPLSEKFGMGISAGFLARGGYSQPAAVSVSGVSGWDFGIESYYFWTHNLQLQAQLSFVAHSADFASPSTTSATSTSQNQRRFSVGARYYF